MYGTASQSKHEALARWGAIPIDYKTQDFVEVLQQAEPEGLDFVFEGMGGNHADRALAVLAHGGKLVAYAAPIGRVAIVKDMFKLIRTNVFSKGRSAEFYGITALYLRDKRPFMEDVIKLFNLLGAKKIKPVIEEKFPILEAQQANELLESGKVIGNIVLVASDY